MSAAQRAADSAAYLAEQWPALLEQGVVLAEVADLCADLSVHGTEVEWEVRLRTDEVVEVIRRRVVGVRGV